MKRTRTFTCLFPSLQSKAMYQFVEIENAVANVFRVHPEWIHQKVRTRVITSARQMAMAFMSFQRFPVSATALFYRRSRGAVDHAVKVMTFEILHYSDKKEMSKSICEKLGYDFEEFLRFCRMQPK
jgi:hypothetical protein